MPYPIRLVMLAAIWGSSFIFMRMAAPQFGALWTAELRVGLAALALLGYGLVLRHKDLLRGTWMQYLMLGVFNTGLPFVCFSYAARHIPASYSAVINAMVPFYSVLFSAWALGERLTLTRLLAVVLGLAGVAIMVGLGPVPLDREVVIALLVAGIAPVCYGIALVYTKKCLTHLGSLQLSASGLTASSLMLLPLAMFDLPAQNPTWLAWTAAGTLALLCTAFAYILFFGLIAEVGPTKTAMVTFLVPAFSFLWAVLFLGEHITAQMLLGFAMVLTAVMLVLQINPLAWLNRNSAQDATPP